MLITKPVFTDLQTVRLVNHEPLMVLELYSKIYEVTHSWYPLKEGGVFHASHLPIIKHGSFVACEYYEAENWYIGEIQVHPKFIQQYYVSESLLQSKAKDPEHYNFFRWSDRFHLMGGFKVIHFLKSLHLT